MYLEHFGLNEAPFRITPHTDFFFAGGNRGATLDALIYAITHDEGIVKVSGEVGSGKTMLCRVLMERLPEKVTIIYLANPSLSREDILFAIADELNLDVPPDARAAMVLRSLQEHLIQSYSAGRQVVVLIDEAHAMPTETLEEIRLLSNLESNRNKLLQLVLFGQPELNEILARPDMRQLKERITHNFALEPLIRSDIASYLDFRMRAAGYKGPNVFSDKAIQAITKASQGLTRRINILADKSLLAAYSASNHHIGPREAQAAIKDSDFSEATLGGGNLFPVKHIKIGLALVIATLIGAGVASYFNKSASTPSTHTDVQPQIAAGQVASGALNNNTSLASSQSPPASTAGNNTQDEKAPVPTTTTANNSQSAVPVAPSPESATENKLSAIEQQPHERLGPLTTQGLESGKKWLANANNPSWFLQLLLSDGNRPRAVEAFMQNARAAGIDMEKVRVYHSEVSGKRRYGVIYGDFDSRSSASNAIKDLPKTVRIGRPYPRQVVQLR